MTTIRKPTKAARALVDAWNTKYPPGSPVLYYSDSYARPALNATCGPAHLQYGAPVVRLLDRSGHFYLSHIHPTTPDGAPIVTRAFTVYQPWAAALVHAFKDGENRRRRIFTPPVGGMFVAVHAGLGLMDEDVCRDFWPECPPRNELPTGVVVGVVRFLPPDDPHMGSYSDWRDRSQVWYPRGEYVALDDPVRCGGRQGLWTLPEGIVGAVQRQLPGIREWRIGS